MRKELKLTRRELLRWSAGSLLAAGLWPGALGADGKAGGEEFYFLVVNDLHYRDERCGKWLEGVIAKMKGHKQKIDFCLVLGDLAENGKPEELTAVRDLLKGLGKTTHVVIGNHEYRTQEDRKPFEELFPKRLNYSFEARGWQWLGLDTTQGRLARNTSIQAPTLRWLDDNLAKLDKKRPTLVFTHFPLALPSVMGCPKNADELLKRFQ